MFTRSSRGQEDLSLETISKIEACLGIQILPTSVMKSIIPINRNFADSAMAKFILNRPDDYLSLSKKRIIGTTLKWFVILMVGAIMLRIACVAIYMSMGVNPIVCAYYMHKCRVWYILLGLAAVGVLIDWLICRFTTDEQWKEWRKKYIIPAMWISAIGFGLLHFRAFSVLNGQVLPFALATIMVPMAGGCAITYARVNLGFWWGVLLHCIINIPGVLMIVSSII